MIADMPAAEVDVSAELVASLLQDQCPHLLRGAVTHIAFGWDNFSFRIGDDLVARMPRRRAAVPLVANESRWLPVVAPHLPLPVPAPVFVGEPGRGYPWPWTVVPWIPGSPIFGSDLDLEVAAEDLGVFLRSLHRPAPDDAPDNPYRGVPLADRDPITRERILGLDLHIDVEAVLRSWDSALATDVFDGAPTWLHGDLHPANLLAVDGRLSGVIDFGDITAGDPATDLAVAWMLFPGGARAAFRESYGAADDTMWSRARGWALSLSVAYLANSANNSQMREIGATTLSRVVDGS